MKKPKNVLELKIEIANLEQKQQQQLELLKQNASQTFENLKPANLLKNTLESAISLPAVKNVFFDNALGLAIGYISQKLIIKNKDTFASKIFGMLVNLVVTHVVTHNADTIKHWGEQIIQFITRAKKQIEDHENKNVNPSEQK